DIYNYSMKRVRFMLEISLRTDFADIFEVKMNRLVRKGDVTTKWDQDKSELISNYEHEGFERSMVTCLLESGSAAIYNNGRISLRVDLAPRGSWHTCSQHLMDKKKAHKTRQTCVHVLTKAGSEVEKDLQEWRRVTTGLTSSNEEIYRLFKQSLEDMAALRLP